MSTDLSQLAWPLARLEEAIEALARASGANGQRLERRAPDPKDKASLEEYISDVAGGCGLELQSISFGYAETDRFLARLRPTLLRLPGTDLFLVILTGGRRRLSVLSPSGARARVAAVSLKAALEAPAEARVAAGVDAMLARARLAPRASRRARRAILAEQLSDAQLGGGWHARLPASAPFSTQLRRSGLLERAGQLLSAHVVNYLLVMLGWWIMGMGVLSGRVDRGWLWAWALVMVSALPFRLLALATEGQLAVEGGLLLRRRLMGGVLKLDPDQVRSEGIGRLLGRVLESEAVEALALDGGFAAALACVELLCALVVIGLGASGPLHALLLAACVLGVLIEARAEHRAHQRYTDAKVAVTQELVEGMVGHRTRLVQSQREQWHAREDVLLADDLACSRELDRRSVRLIALAPRLTMLVGLMGLWPLFVAGQVVPSRLAISIGGVLLATAAMRRLVGGITSLSGARVAFRTIAPLFNAAALRERPGLAQIGATAPGAPLLEAEGLGYRHLRRGEPVLNGTHLKIQHGDRILLEGPSGGGKSTLGALLAGLRVPERGLLLLHGYDLGALGDRRWRERVAMAPQFHENHLFAGTLAFNLLMGRAWPPSRADMEEALAICQELELGPLLERMPGGIEQMVGETGWQLSHGERSRVYLARALLQGADLVVLDESFAALDPATLERALDCVLRRAPAALVIAHP